MTRVCRTSHERADRLISTQPLATECKFGQAGSKQTAAGGRQRRIGLDCPPLQGKACTGCDEGAQEQARHGRLAVHALEPALGHGVEEGARHAMDPHVAVQRGPEVPLCTQASSAQCRVPRGVVRPEALRTCSSSSSSSSAEASWLAGGRREPVDQQPLCSQLSHRAARAGCT